VDRSYDPTMSSPEVVKSVLQHSFSRAWSLMREKGFVGLPEDLIIMRQEERVFESNGSVMQGLLAVHESIILYVEQNITLG
jgi:hypothetical protein